MKSFATRIDIYAPVEKVWQLLTDLPGWVRWNTTIERTVGNVERGAKVTVFVKVNPGRAFALRVTELEAPHRMVWADGMPFGLFKGARIYELARSSDANTVFSMREDYTGPLAVLITKFIPNLQPAFDEFAQCLKREAERR
jgi:hypothetical protein